MNFIKSCIVQLALPLMFIFGIIVISAFVSFMEYYSYEIYAKVGNTYIIEGDSSNPFDIKPDREIIIVNKKNNYIQYKEKNCNYLYNRKSSLFFGITKPKDKYSWN